MLNKDFRTWLLSDQPQKYNGQLRMISLEVIEYYGESP